MHFPSTGYAAGICGTSFFIVPPGFCVFPGAHEKEEGTKRQRGEHMARTGRPKKEIDQKTFEELCAIQCTEAEICAVLGVCEDTLGKWCKRTYKMTFSEAFKSKSCLGKKSLRRTQFKLAEKNAAMAIWLGKQYLEQKDVVEQNINADEVKVVIDV